MNKKWFPHIIAVTAFAVFIVLGLGSCDLPKDSDENNGGNSSGSSDPSGNSNGGTTPTNRTIVIKNNTGYSIGSYGGGLWIKPSSSLDWGSSLGFFPLSNGESYTYTLPANITNNGIYDIRFNNYSGNGYFTKYKVSLSFGMTLTFTASDLELK